MRATPFVGLSSCALILCWTLGSSACSSPEGGGDEPGGGAASNPACTIPLGWWESKDLNPFFAVKKSAPPTVDCQFHLWAWSAFVHFTQLDASGRPAFLSLRLPSELSGGGPSSGRLQLTPRDVKHSQEGEINQAGSNGVLVDQRGRAVYYSTHMDDAYFSFAQANYGVDKFKAASPDSVFPVGSTVLKASWRQVGPGEDTSGFFTMSADIAKLVNSKGSSGTVEVSRDPKTNEINYIKDVEVALVGMHVVSVLVDHPEFAWATFELEDNSPNLPSGVQPGDATPVSQENFTFYAGGALAKDCNVFADGTSVRVDEDTQICAPITQVFREFQYGGASESDAADIRAVNAEFQSQLPTEAKNNPKLDAVFASYTLVGTVWQDANTLKPGDGAMDRSAIGSVDLMNSTMETFVQGKGSSCFSCHNTAKGDKGPQGPKVSYPASNLGLSHVLLGPFFE